MEISVETFTPSSLPYLSLPVASSTLKPAAVSLEAFRERLIAVSVYVTQTFNCLCHLQVHGFVVPQLGKNNISSLETLIFLCLPSALGYHIPSLEARWRNTRPVSGLWVRAELPSCLGKML